MVTSFMPGGIEIRLFKTTLCCDGTNFPNGHFTTIRNGGLPNMQRNSGNVTIKRGSISTARC